MPKASSPNFFFREDAYCRLVYTVNFRVKSDLQTTMKYLILIIKIICTECMQVHVSILAVLQIKWGLLSVGQGCVLHYL